MATPKTAPVHPMDRMSPANARHSAVLLFPGDDETGGAYEAARARLTLIESNDPKSGKLTAARRELATAAKAIEAVEGTLKFRVHSLGRKRWEQLMDEHPPTDEQAAEAKAAGGVINWNPDTFPPAAIAACAELMDGDEAYPLTDEQGLELWDEKLSNGEANRLVTAIIEINGRQRVVVMGKGLPQTRG